MRAWGSCAQHKMNHADHGLVGIPADVEKSCTFFDITLKANMPQSRVVVQPGELKNTCFVIMPFQPLFGKQYDSVIRPAIEASGLNCVRGDEIYTQQSIVQDIWGSLRESRLVVAELSGRNPNVMYEVGLAHAIGKPIILLTRNQEDVPFDLKALRYVFYDTNNPDWGADLRSELSKAITRVLESPAMAAHLTGVTVESAMPIAPTGPVATTPPVPSSPDISGVWQGHWISVHRERNHAATLIIPTDHGSEFTASLTVVYEKSGARTIVEETLTATIVAKALSLVGVNYTYIQQGASSSYSLDSFNLNVADDHRTMTGKVVLAHGIRDIVFTRVYPETSG